MTTAEIIERLNELGYAVRVQHLRRWSYPMPKARIATKREMRKTLESDPYVGRALVEPVLEPRGGKTLVQIVTPSSPRFPEMATPLLIAEGEARTWEGDNYNKASGTSKALDRALDQDNELRRSVYAGRAG